MRSRKINLSRLRLDIIVDGLYEMEEYNYFMKAAIGREQKEVAERIEAGALKLPEHAREEYYQWYAEDYIKIRSIFKKLALESMITTLYSLVESGLLIVSEVYGVLRGIDGGFMENGKGSYLDQIRVYLEKTVGIPLHVGKNEQWRQVVALRLLRNALTHNRGRLATKNHTLRTHVKSGLIEVSQPTEEEQGKLPPELKGKVTITEEYIDFILPQVQQFFKDIMSTAENALKEKDKNPGNGIAATSLNFNTGKN